MNSANMKMYSLEEETYGNHLENRALNPPPSIISLQRKWPEEKRAKIPARFELQLLAVREIINRSPSDTITVRDLAERIGTNEHRLRTGFKLLFGMTLFKYRQYTKMTLARRLLENGEKTIKEIAYQLGYSNIANFTNAFKLWYGYPPSKLKNGSYR